MKCTNILETCALSLITVFIDYIQTQIRVTNILLYMEGDILIFFPKFKKLRKYFYELIYSIAFPDRICNYFLGIQI